MSLAKDRTSTNLALLMLRVMVAAVFIYHGGQNFFVTGVGSFARDLDRLGIPLPTLSAYLAAGTEFVGGILLLLGLFVRLAVVPLIFVMVVGILTVHRGAFSAEKGGMEYALTLAVTLAVIGLLGPGKYALKAPRRSD
ncbi:MAG: DoxX family protein [Planctomycetota bacterium]